MHGTMQVMDSSGHTTVTWDPDNASSVRDAKRQFDDLRSRGYQAFMMNSVHENGAVVEEKGERITSFPPTAGKVMMVPQLRGG